MANQIRPTTVPALPTRASNSLPGSEALLNPTVESPNAVISLLTVPRGQMTFDAEGIESPGSIYHTRVAHQPTLNSGITIGRGYDMKLRTHQEVLNDLLRSGVSVDRAEVLAEGAGLTGEVARNWLRENKPVLPEITLLEQKKLFSEVTYPWYVQETERLVKSWSPGARSSWSRLSQPMQDFLIDLRYRGDFNKAVYAELRPALESKSLSRLQLQVANSEYFKSVPKARQQARLNFLEQAASNFINSRSTTVSRIQNEGRSSWSSFSRHFSTDSSVVSAFIR